MSEVFNMDKYVEGYEYGRLEVGDIAKVVVDSQFNDNLKRRIGEVGEVVEVDPGDEWAYCLMFEDGSRNWFKRYALQKQSASLKDAGQEVLMKAYCKQCNKETDYELEKYRITRTISDPETGDKEVDIDLVRHVCKECRSEVNVKDLPKPEDASERILYTLKICSTEAEYISKALHAYLLYASGIVDDSKRSGLENSIMSMYDSLNQVWLYDHTSIDIDEIQIHYMTDAIKAYRCIVGEFWDKILTSEEMMHRMMMHSSLIKKLDMLLHPDEPLDIGAEVTFV